MMKRNLQLDYLKIILSIFVIGIHTPVFTNPSINLLFRNGIFRIAVPVFLLVNGYYLCKSIGNANKIMNLVKRLFILYLVWWVIYLPLFYQDFDFASILHGYGHLWYLTHLAFSILLFFALKRINISDKLLFVAAICLYICGYLIQTGQTLGFSFPIDVLSKHTAYRNFLLFCFPFLFLGYSVGSSPVWGKLANYKFYFLVLGLIILIFETIVLNQELYISSLIIAPLLFLWFKDKPLANVEDDFYSKLYIAIYLSHFLVIKAVNLTFGSLSVGMRFIFVVFFTLLLSVNIIYLNRKIKIFL